MTIGEFTLKLEAMMDFLIRTIVTLLCFSMSFFVSSENFHAELAKRDKENIILIMYHDGFSDKSVSVSSLCRSGIGGLTFKVSNDKGDIFPMTAVINDGCLLNENILLSPFDVYGKIINIRVLLSAYGIKDGTYSLQAEICNLEKSNNNCFKSNIVTISLVKDKGAN